MKFSDVHEVKGFAEAAGVPYPNDLTTRLWNLTNAIVDWPPTPEEQKARLREQLLSMPLRHLAPRPQGPTQAYTARETSKVMARHSWIARLWAVREDTSRPIEARRLAFVLCSLLHGWFGRESRLAESDPLLVKLRDTALDPAFAPVADYFAYCMGHAGTASAPGKAAVNGLEGAVRDSGFVLLDDSLPPGIARVVALFEAKPRGTYVTAGEIEAAFRGTTEATSKASTIATMMERHGYVLDAAKNNADAPPRAKGYRLLRA